MSDAEIRELVRATAAGDETASYRARVALVRQGRVAEAGLQIGDRVMVAMSDYLKRELGIEKAEGLLVDESPPSFSDDFRWALDCQIKRLEKFIWRPVDLTLTAPATPEWSRDGSVVLRRPVKFEFVKQDPYDSPFVEVWRLTGGRIKRTNCCCDKPGDDARACADERPVALKHPCRCDCHKGAVVKAVYRRMTEEEAGAAYDLSRARFQASSFDKRFARGLAAQIGARRITEKQATLLWAMIVRYRRQVPAPVVRTALAHGATLPASEPRLLREIYK
jgi:hypothetical protein